MTTRDRALAALVFLVALACYLHTLLPGVGLWDTAEFQTVPVILGIMHATGYPLYTLLGKLVTLVPWAAPAYQLNAFSAACAAAAAALTVLLARRLGAGSGPAVMAGLALAFFMPLWGTALRADPHTLHTAFVLVLATLVVAWRAHPVQLWPLALATGLSLSNHMQTTMLLPGLALATLWGRWRSLTPKALGTAAAAFALGLSPYLYLPLRARQQPPLDYGRPVDWEHFRALVTGEHFHQDMGLLSPKGVETFLVQAGRLPGLYANWLPNGLAIGLAIAAVAGLVALFRRDRALAAGLALMGFAPLYWACTWINGDADRYFIAPTCVLVLLAAVGLEALLALTRRPKLAAGLGVLAALTPLSLIAPTMPRVDRSHEHAGADFIARVHAQLPPGAVVFTVWVDSTPLWYARYVEQRRPDVRIVDDSEVVLDHGSDLPAAIRAFAGRPRYVLHPASDLPAVERAFTTRQLGTVEPFFYPLVEVRSPRP